MSGRIVTRLVAVAAGVALLGLAGWVVVLHGRLGDAQDLVDGLRERLAEARSATQIVETSARREHQHSALTIERLRRDLNRSDAVNRRLNRELDDFACLQDEHGRATTVRGPLRGDVDGDGVTDDVYTEAHRTVEGACRYRVVVKTTTGTLRKTIDPEGKDLPAVFRPFMLADLNDAPGRELFVQVIRGAYAQVVRPFTVDSGELGRIRGFGRGDLWLEGSSLGNGVGLDCVDGRAGEVVYTTYAYGRHSGYDVTRRFYELSGTVASRSSVDRYHVGLEELDRFPELARDAALLHCPNRVSSASLVPS